MTKEYKTQNDIPSNTKKTVIELLNKTLAVVVDLALVTKQAHWNLRGPGFIMIHEMLDKFREELDEHVDNIAERAPQLGGTAYGTAQEVVKASPLKPYPTDIHAVPDHLDALIERYAEAANMMRRAIDEADEAGDADTADIFTAASRTLDKNLWLLEAHTPAKPA